MKKPILLLVCVLVVFSGWKMAAQRPEASFPLIVVFDDNAPFQSLENEYRPDDRAAANPAAWGYLNRGVAGLVQSLERRHGFRAEHVYSAAIRGFSARLTARQIAELENDLSVSYVELDGVMTIVQRSAAPGNGRGNGGGSSSQVVPWGIAKVGATTSPTWIRNGSGTAVVNAYIIDTGIDAGHRDLFAINVYNAAGGVNSDCNGHGTHVAGTVAALNNNVDVVGVAPFANLFGVKVLGCGGSGTTSGVIAGVDWVTANAQKPAVANMSLGGGVSNALDDAVRRSAAAGVLYSIAAGNSGAGACTASPARAGAGANNGIVTTAATDSADKEASWSNYGSCVDIWAPGVSILSTKMGGGTTTFSGTSMAAPHVGGGAALYLSNFPSASPAAVEQALKAAVQTPGTKSKNGYAITRLWVGGF